MTPAGGWCVRDGVFDVRQNVRHFIGGISVRSHRLAPLVWGQLSYGQRGHSRFRVNDLNTSNKGHLVS